MHTISTLQAHLNSKFIKLIALIILLFLGFQGTLSAQTCPVSNEISISVYPQPAISLTGSTTICSSGNATLTATPSGGVPLTCTVSWESSPTGAAGSWTPIPAASAPAAATNPYTTTALTATTYYHAILSCTETSCTGATSNTQVVTVVPAISITTQPVGFDECLTGNSTLSVVVAGAVGTTPPLTYQWQYSPDGTNGWTNVTTGSGGTSPTFTPSSAATGTSWYRVNIASTVSGCGTKTSDAVKVVVNDILAITTQPVGFEECTGGNKAASVVIVGGVPASTTYQWQVSYDNSNWVDSVGQTTATIVPNSTNPGIRYYRVRITSGGSACGSALSNVITVKISPQIVIVADLPNITECIGGADKLTFNFTGGASDTLFVWESSTTNVAANFTPIVGAPNSRTYTPPFSTKGTTYYRVRVKSNSTNCPEVISAVSTVIVNDVLAITTQPVGFEECAGGNQTLSIQTSGGITSPPLTYQWQSSADGSTNWTAVPTGGTGSSYIPQSTTPGSTFYRVIVTSTGSACGTVTSNPVKVKISPQIVVVTDLTNITECIGGTDKLTFVFTGGASDTSFVWESSLTGVAGSFTALAVQPNSRTYQPISTVKGTTFYRVRVKSSNTNCPEVISGTATVIVNDVLAITTQPTDFEECTGGTQTLSVITSGGITSPPLTYQWQSSADGSTNWLAVASGGNAATYTPSSAIVGTTYYRVIVTSTGSACGIVTSNAAKVKISPQIVVVTDLQNITECVGGTDKLTFVFTGGSSDSTFVWEISTTGAGGPWSPVSVQPNSRTYQPLSTAAFKGTRYYRVRVQSALTSCPEVASAVATVIVNDVLAITTQPTDFEECTGGTQTLSVVTSGGITTPPLTYQWQSSADGSTNWLAVASGGNAATYTPLSNTPGTTYYRVIVTSTGSACGIVTSNAAKVKVSPQIVIVTDLQNITECIGGTDKLTLNFTGGASDSSFVWESSTTGAAGSFSPVSVQPNARTYQPSSTVNGTTYYRVRVKSGISSCPETVSGVATVIINDVLAILTQPTDFSECTNGTQSLTVNTTGGITGQITYIWQQSTVSAAGPFTNAAGANTGPTYTPVSTTDGITYYRVVVTSAGSACGTVTSNAATVTVTKQISITAQPQPILECINGNKTLTVTATGGSGILHYKWFLSSTLGGTYTAISNSDNATYLPNSVSDGITYYKVEISAPGNGCSNITSTPVAVDVRKQLAITTDLIGFIECTSGLQTLNVVVTNGTGAANLSYEWFSSSNASGPFNAIANSNNATYTPPSGTVGTLYYNVKITDNGSGCDVLTSKTVAVTINPQLTINSQPQPLNECTSANQTITVGFINGAGAMTFQWEKSTDNLAFSSISGAIGQTFTPPNAAAGTMYYRVVITSSGDGCNVVTSNSAKVVVSPQLSIVASPQDIDECIGGTSALSVNVANGSGTVSYQWVSSPDQLSWSNITGEISPSFTPPSAVAGIIYYRCIIKASDAGCGDLTSGTAKVTIFDRPSLDVKQSVPAVCTDGQVLLSATKTGGAGSCIITWQVNSGSGYIDVPTQPTPDNKYLTPPLKANVKYQATIKCSGSGCCN